MPGVDQHGEHAFAVGVAARIVALLAASLLDLFEDQLVGLLALAPEGCERPTRVSS